MKKGLPIHRPKTKSDFDKLNREMRERGFVALDALKPGLTRSFNIINEDINDRGAEDLSARMTDGILANGPISKVAWSFDGRESSTVSVSDKKGGNLGLGYVKWGANNNLPSVIPPMAMALPYTAAPLRYIADLTAGLGPRLMYKFGEDDVCEFRYAGKRLMAIVDELERNQDNDANPAAGIMGVLNNGEPEGKESLRLKQARKDYENWEKTWFGYDVTEEDGSVTHVPGAKEFLENNNLDLHLSRCEQDDVMMDIYFPTVGLQRGRKGLWNDPKIVSVDVLPCHSVRLEKMNEYRHINHCYFSDAWRTLGTGKSTEQVNNQVVMYPAVMPEHILSDLRYIVKSNRRSRIKDRPTWIVCPTYYPSGQRPYYPQPAWWSVFTSKAFDFSSTILYDKAKARENSTSWGKIIYISLDYLSMVYADKGIAGDLEAQQKFIDELDNNVEEFLKLRENNGKMMRQFKWTDQHTGKDVYNVEIADVSQTKSDTAKAGKEELELSTSPIFLALQVDPRLVGVPMVAPSNGGTALREMHLLKQQQLNVKQRLYLQFLNTVAKFNGWDEHAEFCIMQQTLTTLDNSKTGTVSTIAGDKA